MIAVSLTGFAIAVWLGCYLLARDPGKPLLRRTAAGLLGFGLAIAVAEVPIVSTVALGVPAAAWTGALLRLPAGRESSAWDPLWRWVFVPSVLGLLAAGAVWESPVFKAVTFAIAAIGLAAAFVSTVRRRDASFGLLALVTILFGLGLAAILLGLKVAPPEVLMAGIGIDLIILGLLTARYEALDEGLRLGADMLRSAATAVAAAVLFGGQVVLAMVLVGGTALTPLLFGCVGAAIAVVVLAAPLHRLLDRVTLPTPVSSQRSELRDAIESLPRRGRLDDVDDTEFVRLTRRALSHYADLGRLVASPLTELDVIDARLAARDAPDLPLERAAELKTMLREAIDKLKPDGDFGLSDEWRHFNSLYYIYVVGLRPYSQRARYDGLTPDARKALQWFRTAVPQRSLHNWQNAAARLVAVTIRDGRPKV